MCMIINVHRTNCETRRRVIVNPLLGTTIFHPFEVPNPCEHQQFIRNAAECPAHGPCCAPTTWKYCDTLEHGTACRGWQWYHLVDTYLNPVALPSTARLFLADEIMPMSGDEHVALESLRKNFFAAGADLYHIRCQAEYLQKHLRDYVQDPEALTDKYLDTHEHFQEHTCRLSRFKEAWTCHNSLGSMEPCPSLDFLDHPWVRIYQLCEEVNSGFSVINGDISLIFDRTPDGAFGLEGSKEVYPEENAEALALSPTLEAMCMDLEEELQIKIEEAQETFAALDLGVLPSPFNQEPRRFLYPVLVDFEEIDWDDSAKKAIAPPESPRGTKYPLLYEGALQSTIKKNCLNPLKRKRSDSTDSKD